MLLAPHVIPISGLNDGERMEESLARSERIVTDLRERGAVEKVMNFTSVGWE